MTVAAGSQSNIPQWTRGDRLRKSLEHAGMSVQDMSDQLGMSRGSISGWIHDKHEPSAPALRLWAMVTGVPLRWIVDGIEPGDDDGPGGNVVRWAPRGSNPQPTVSRFHALAAA